ncbi:MAG TPA: LysM peptidoglycan-binding domain-containing protein [Candidatus Brocadiaceae bacterium]|nr:LysM peptidoglycan-binding domain-containing protein [Candidatus Brocadiaceae bacterium]
MSEANLAEIAETDVSASEVAPATQKAKTKSTKSVKPVTPTKSATSAKSTDSAKGGKIVHTVKKGETLKRIAKNYGVSAKSIRKANHLKDKKELEVGQKIVIPSSGKVASSSTESPSSKAASGGKQGATPRGFVWPVKGTVVSTFGEKRNGVKNVGLGILPQSGQKVVASKRGVVEAVSATGLGKCTIIIKHEEGYRTFYEGCSNPVVGEKAKIEQGQPIASLGGDGAGQPQELIFKLYVKDKPVNPASYLP